MEIGKREKSIRSRSCAELLQVARLGIGWRASPAKDQSLSSPEKGDISNLEKWVTFLFCVDIFIFL
jgi:hypothetical protein